MSGTPKTQDQLDTEITNLWPDNTIGLITPAVARTTLFDMVASGAAVTSLSALAGLAIPPGHATVVVADLVQGGTFIWNSANLSMQVANNPGQGIYVAPATDPTGASGAWEKEGLTGINAAGATNISALTNPPLVSDGLTSNVPAFQSLASVLQSANTEMPVPVNISVGSPTVLSLNPTAASGGTLPNPTTHFLKPNQAFYIIQTGPGTIPIGLPIGTPCYIRAGIQGVGGITPTTFTFSLVNNYGPTVGEGPAVNTAGSFTGTFSIVLTGRDVSVTIPPGPYFGGNFGDSIPALSITPNGMTRVRYFGYGATFDTKTSVGVVDSAVDCIVDARTWAIGPNDLVNTTPNDNNQPIGVNGILTLPTAGDAVNYYPGQWLSLFGYNVQDSYNHAVSGPPNCQYHEFKQIISINTGANQLTLDGPTRWVYLSTFPQLFTPHSVFVAGGAASIAPMHPAWDCSVEIFGITWAGEPTVPAARRMIFTGCTSQGFANFAAQTAPALCQTQIYRDHTFGPDGTPGATYMEVDKMLEYLELNNCRSSNQFRIQFTSPSLQVCKIKGLQNCHILGTPRAISVESSPLDSMLVGPFIGVTDVCDVQNSPIKFFDMQARSDDPFDLLTGARSIGPTNDMTLVANWSFSGGIFTRNISSLPGSQGMLWPMIGGKYYMIDAGGIFKANQNMGSPFTILNAYMDGSGNYSIETTLQAVPTRQTSGTVSISNASPGVVTFTGSNLSAGTPVIFPATATVPTPFAVSTPYYVAASPAPTANTFSLAATVGGSAINTTGSGSGITTFVNPLCFRPHPCTSFTGIGNSASSTLVSMNGAIDEPLFSRLNWAFVGKQSTLGGNQAVFQAPNSRAWGYIKTITVTVWQAGTASGTMTITSPGFKQSDNSLSTSNFSAVIDSTTVGTRVITNAAATTSAELGSDSFAFYPDWLAGPMLFAWSTGVTLANSALVTIEVRTDQGVTRFGNMMGAPATPSSGSNLWIYGHSGIRQQFGTSP